MPWALLALLVGGAVGQTVAPPSSPITPIAENWGAPVVESNTPSIAAVATSPSLFADGSVRLAQAPALSSDPLDGSDPFAVPGTPRILWPPPGGREGSFQSVTFQSSYLPAFEDDSLGITSVGASARYGLPFPDRASPLLITPGFETLFLDGPDFVDVPPRVHAATVEFSHFRLLSDRWLVNVAATVGLYADDDSFGEDDALRVTGRGLAIYQWTHQWKTILGIVFLNRGDVSVLPAFGLQYEDLHRKVDLIFPRPQIAWRIDGGGPPGPGAEQQWIFIGGEFGGNEYAIQNEIGADTLDYSDIRLQVGYEVKRFGGLSTKYEFGYVFARELEFDSVAEEIELDDTLFVRVGFKY